MCDDGASNAIAEPEVLVHAVLEASSLESLGATRGGRGFLLALRRLFF